MPRTILLFDVDGTLVLSGGAGARALDRAFQALHGVADGMKGIGPGGKTDPAIVREIFVTKLGRAPTSAEMDAIYRAYLPFLAEEVASSRGFVVMPGVASLLAGLTAREDVLLGLVTGNIEEGARIKLARPGLIRHFRFGGFGSDSEDRDHLTRIGVERGRALAGGMRRETGRAAAAAAERVIVVGDTLHDIKAGRSVGALTVAVATGSVPYEALAIDSADVVLRDLSDPAPLLALIERG
jgi:phosphoglycolate phosphatase-like HAD superfamily hydrolase